MTRLAAILVTVVGLLVGATIGLPSLFAHGDDAAGDLRGSVSILRSETAQPYKTVLPPSITTSATAKRFDPRGVAVQAAEKGGARYFVVEGINNELCVIQAGDSGGSSASATSCAPRQSLKKDGTIFVEGLGVTDQFTIFGVVSDAYHTVELSSEPGSEPVENNFFVLTPEVDKPGELSKIILSGDGAPTERIEASTGVPDLREIRASDSGSSSQPVETEKPPNPSSVP